MGAFYTPPSVRKLRAPLRLPIQRERMRENERERMRENERERIRENERERGYFYIFAIYLLYVCQIFTIRLPYIYYTFAKYLLLYCFAAVVVYRAYHTEAARACVV